jgi:hypothetical protein
VSSTTPFGWHTLDTRTGDLHRAKSEPADFHVPGMSRVDDAADE